MAAVFIAEDTKQKLKDLLDKASDILVDGGATTFLVVASIENLDAHTDDDANIISCVKKADSDMCDFIAYLTEFSNLGGNECIPPPG